MKTLFHYRLTIALVAFISLLCLLPLSPSPVAQNHMDLLVHALMFFTLTTSYLIEAQLSSSQKRSFYYLTALFLVFCLGATTELSQHYSTAQRNGSWLDFASDLFGCLAAELLHLCYAPWLKSVFSK